MVVEFAVIVALLWGVSSEYRANQFMQTWVTKNAWPLQFLLNGYFASMLLGVLIGVLGLRINRNRKKESGE